MDEFYTYVAIGAAVILIIVLIAFGVMMSELHTTDLFPPTYQTCPDMWEINASGGCVVPRGDTAKNRGLLTLSTSSPYVTTSSGDGSLPRDSSESVSSKPLINAELTSGSSASLNLNDASIMNALYPSKSDRCSKKQWALNNGIVWDGVTNYNGC